MAVNWRLWKIPAIFFSGLRLQRPIQLAKRFMWLDPDRHRPSFPTTLLWILQANQRQRAAGHCSSQGRCGGMSVAGTGSFGRDRKKSWSGGDFSSGSHASSQYLAEHSLMCTALWVRPFSFLIAATASPAALQACQSRSMSACWHGTLLALSSGLSQWSRCSWSTIQDWRTPGVVSVQLCRLLPSPCGYRYVDCAWQGCGEGIAQWLDHRTRDWKVTGSSPCKSGGIIFFSRVSFLCWLLFRYLQ